VLGSKKASRYKWAVMEKLSTETFVVMNWEDMSCVKQLWDDNNMM
jgi:hypothetical protein